MNCLKTAQVINLDKALHWAFKNIHKFVLVFSIVWIINALLTSLVAWKMLRVICRESLENCFSLIKFDKNLDCASQKINNFFLLFFWHIKALFRQLIASNLFQGFYFWEETALNSSKISTIFSLAFWIFYLLTRY